VVAAENVDGEARVVGVADLLEPVEELLFSGLADDLFDLFAPLRKKITSESSKEKEGLVNEFHPCSHFILSIHPFHSCKLTVLYQLLWRKKGKRRRRK